MFRQMKPTLFGLGVLGFLQGLAAGALPDGSRPNIILILSDDVGLSRVGCYGGAPFKTPNLDRLAATGLRFDRCYSMPLCGPSRAALLTGKYPFRTGATGNGNSEIDPARHPTIANALRDAGYATCAIGKLGQSAPAEDAAAPRRLGFDESMLWMGRGTPDRYWNPRYYRNGEVVQGKPEQYGPDLTHDFLVDFMRRHRDRPFFAYYSAVLTHGPFVRTPDSKDETNVIPDMVAYLDKQMGRLATDLDNLQLRDRTILLFTSDNGPIGNPLGTIGGRPMLGGKGDTTEGGVREPLIVNCPGLVPAGHTCGDLTDFTDLFPTVLELAGARAPEELGLDGRSIAPQILGRAGRPRDWVYAQVGREYFIADKRHKLYGDGRLVDITDSPIAEKAIDESDPGVAAARARLKAALERLREGFPPDAGARAPLRPEASPDLAADLKLLQEAGIIAETEYWLAHAVAGRQVDGSRSAELILAAANKFRPATGLDEALEVLNREGIVSGVAYWKEHAVEGNTCAGATVARLANKIAQRVRMK
jgi:arylsulfatase A